jgi:DNA-binding beta-propeller fold protein YncE
MRTANRLSLAIPLALTIASCTHNDSKPPSASTPNAAVQVIDYHVARTLHVGGQGGWDYLTVDPDRNRLYAPRSTHTQVIDAANGQIIADIPGQKRNHGVALVPDLHRGFITDGQDASVTIFDTNTNQALGKIKAADDADGAIYDPASKKVLVSCGDASALILIPADVDPTSGKSDSVDLGGKPEFLAADGQGKAYVNLVDKNQVAVVDTRAMKVLRKWPTTPGGSPVGMAIDAAHHRLFVGCRNPQKLIVMSADDGKVLADLPIGAGVDATAFDAGNAFASCRDGTLAVARETSPGKFEIVRTVSTAQGARTMGVNANTHTIYLPTAEFAPNQQGRPAAKPDSFMIVVVEPAKK